MPQYSDNQIGEGCVGSGLRINFTNKGVCLRGSSMEGSWITRPGAISPSVLFVVVLAASLFIADLNFYGITGDPPCLPKNCSATIPVPSVKLLMQDHMGHYVHHYGAEAFEDQFRVSLLPFITPNFVTTTHLFVACLAGYLVGNEHLKWRQVGVGLFQLRTFLDMLDGVVYRRQHNQFMYVNGWGTIGYYIDAVADVVGALFLMWGIYTTLNRHPPRRSEGLPLRNPPEPLTDVPVSTGTIKFSLFLVLMQGLLRSFFWDRFQYSFHTIFATVMQRPADAVSSTHVHTMCAFQCAVMPI